MGLWSSCTLPRTVPDDRFYRLPQLPPDKVLEKSIVSSVLAVAPLSAGGLYNERAILYIDQKRPLELRRYHYHHWVDSPNYLIQENLLAYLRAVKLAARVVRYQPGNRTAASVKGRLLRFERILNGPNVSVMVAIEFTFRDPLGGSGRRWTKEYSASIQAEGGQVEGGSVHATVQAFGTALQQIYESFVSDIKTP